MHGFPKALSHSLQGLITFQLMRQGGCYESSCFEQWLLRIERKLQGLDSGVRRLHRPLGKPFFLTYSPKSGGQLVVESDVERLVAHMLTLDPRVQSFKAQPFTVDLIDRRIHKSAQALTEAKARHRGRRGQKFYTPDFWVKWHAGGGTAIEVKVEGYEGDARDAQRSAGARNY